MSRCAADRNLAEHTKASVHKTNELRLFLFELIVAGP
jgi:hypothetical protein